LAQALWAAVLPRIWPMPVFPVVLLDIVAKEGERSAIAQGALEKLKKADPAPLMSKAAASLITPGNLEDDLDLLKDVDWVIEAVIERLDIKRSLYDKTGSRVSPASCIISSTPPPFHCRIWWQGPAIIAQHFLITHFFNPPRYLRLLELVVGPQTRAEAAQDIGLFCDTRLGKHVVPCKDRPGFIANRIGTFWIQCAYNEAEARGLSVEEADLIMGKPLGYPKTGIFGLMDLVGLDLMPHIAKSLLSSCLPRMALPKSGAPRRCSRR
jgi:3-hydroxyacyl-CoA dehydrogenase